MNVTVEIPENLYRSVVKLAAKTNRRIDEVIADKLEEELSFEALDFEQNISEWSDEEVLALANLKIPDAQAERMSELSELLQAGTISRIERNELEIYLKSSQIATLRKADGIVEAARRGLISSPKDLE
jgi:hypothetical protein